MRATSRTLVAVIAITVIAVCTVLLISRFAGRARLADMTSQHLYTLSAGTDKILAQVNSPVTLKLYYSQVAARKGPEQIRFWNNYYYYVRDLLEEYVRRSGGKLSLQIIDPRPYSDEEEAALSAGIKKFPMANDENFFFGLAATNQYGKTKIIEFFGPDRQEFVEYDLSKLVSDLMQREKRKVGVLSSLPMLGADMSPYLAQMLAAQGKRMPQPWGIVEQMRQTYDVVKAEVKDGAVAGDLDFLMVVHPKDLDEPTRFAIDQYVMKGGKLLVFEDPYCLSDRPQQQPDNPMAAANQNSSSNLNDLLSNWGLEMAPKAIAIDRDLAARGRAREDQQMTTYLPLLALNDRAVNKGEVITSDLHSLQMFFAGSLQKTNRGHAEIRPLIQTTAGNSGTWTPNSPYECQIASPEIINPALVTTQDPLILAATIHGRLQTNFPNGIMLPPPAEEPKDPAQPASKPASQPASKPAKHLDAIRESSDAAMVVVVADVDMISDGGAYQESPLGIVQSGDNASFVLNTLDFLSGNLDLISIRTRGRYSRPFKVVDQIEREAAKNTEEQVAEITSKIQAYQAQLQQLGESAGDKDVKLIANDVLEKRRKVESEIRAFQVKLRQLQAQRRQKVEELGTYLQAWNMAAAPSIILMIAIALAIVRRYKAKKWAARRN